MPDLRAPRRLPPEFWVLTLLAFATRGWRLWAPRVRVWDEVYFQDFASRYFTGSYYFDVHPPFTKLLFALAARLLRVPPDQFLHAEGITAFRVVPAVTGALLVPLVWWLLRELGASRRTALVGAACVLLDTALLVQSRLALTDMPLLVFGVAATTCFVAARRMTGAGHWGMLALAGAMGGAAAATKWTGLTAMGLIGATWLADAWRARTTAPWARRAAELALLAALPLAVYLGAFAVHLRLLPNDGPGAAVMSRPFDATLRGHAAYDPDAHVSFTAKVRELHRVAMATNLGWSSLQHVASSKWYTWPISKHRIMLWKDSSAAPGTEARMDIQGNPTLWYGVLAVIGLFVALLAVRRVTVDSSLRWPMAFLGAAYLMNFVPFAFIARPMYLYHYNFALVFSIALAALMMGQLCGWQDERELLWRGTTRRARAWLVGAVVVVAVGFVYFAPLAYGTPLSVEGAAQRRWVLERQ